MGADRVHSGTGGKSQPPRLMSTLLFGITATDQTTFTLISLLLVAVAAIASYLPARRATKVDPIIALQYA